MMDTDRKALAADIASVFRTLVAGDPGASSYPVYGRLLIQAADLLDPGEHEHEWGIKVEVLPNAASPVGFVWGGSFEQVPICLRCGITAVEAAQ